MGPRRGYAASSATATRLAPFTQPELGSTLNPFAQRSANYITGLDGFLTVFGTDNIAVGAILNSVLGNSIFASGFFVPAQHIGAFVSLLGGGLGGFGGAVSAELGDAASVGPPVGTADMEGACPAHQPPNRDAGGGYADGYTRRACSRGPGIPLVDGAGAIEGRAVRQYGFRPSFVARPPAAG